VITATSEAIVTSAEIYTSGVERKSVSLEINVDGEICLVRTVVPVTLSANMAIIL